MVNEEWRERLARRGQWQGLARHSEAFNTVVCACEEIQATPRNFKVEQAEYNGMDRVESLLIDAGTPETLQWPSALPICTASFQLAVVLSKLRGARHTHEDSW